MTSILDKIDALPQVDPEKDYLPDLVGEGRKFKDATELARAKVHSDVFIQRLEAENEDLREYAKSMRVTKNLEEMLDQMQTLKKPEPPSNEDNQNSERDEKQSQQLTVKDVEALLQRREAETSAKKNRDDVINRMQQNFGTNYTSKIQEVASQLSVTPQYLDQIAVSNPSAFYRLMGMDQQKQQDVSVLTPPRNQMTTTPRQTGVKDWTYYEKMRKEKPDQYHSPQIQNEMWNEALKQQEAFYPRS